MPRYLLILALSSALAQAAPSVQPLLDKVADSTASQYLLSLPAGYAKQPAKRWPLVLFLHGAGERGQDLDLTRGWPQLQQQLKNKAILVAPQIPYEDLSWSTELLSQLLNRLESQYQIDPQRVYVTGYSLGGFGALALARAEPQRFAALAVVAGGDPDLAGVSDVGLPAQPIHQSSYCQLKQTPVWLEHGGQDPLVPVSLAEELAKTLQNCGLSPQLHISPKLDHNLYQSAYTNKALLKWLLAQKNPHPARHQPSQTANSSQFDGLYQLGPNQLQVKYQQGQLWISVKHLGDDNPEFLRNNRRFVAYPTTLNQYSSQLGFIQFDANSLTLGRIGRFQRQP